MKHYKRPNVGRKTLGPLRLDSPDNVAARVSSPRKAFFWKSNSRGMVQEKEYGSLHEPADLSTPPLSSAQYSSKSNGIAEAFSVLTHNGCLRDYNEDRVSIILNISRPVGKKCTNWPNACFFGLFDGHGGVECANFLKDHLYSFIIENKAFPERPSEAIHNGIMEAEHSFLKLADVHTRELGRRETSGSCAVICLIVDRKIYIANVGDSRAILSSNKGTEVRPLTKDHKPNSIEERERIEGEGGRIYQSSKTFYTPYRVFPGKLSVSRTIGDMEAKLTKYRGNPRVVIPTPDIFEIDLEDSMDFIFMGSDGIFDKMTNGEVAKCVWKVLGVNSTIACLHRACGKALENVLGECLERRAIDNLSGIIIGLPSLKLQTKVLQGSIPLRLLHQTESHKTLLRLLRKPIKKVEKDLQVQSFEKPRVYPGTSKSSSTRFTSAQGFEQYYFRLNIL